MGRIKIFFWFLICLFGNHLRAGTITVCQSCEVKSIKEGVVLAADFDTLSIKKGTYKEFNIQVTKPLTIIGENYPVIDVEDK